MDSKKYSQLSFDQDFVLEMTFGAPAVVEWTPAVIKPEYEWYRPGFFTRLTSSRPMVIALVIAFVLFILGPSLFWLLNPPHAAAPKPVGGIPVHAPAPDRPAPTLPAGVKVI